MKNIALALALFASLVSCTDEAGKSELAICGFGTIECEELCSGEINLETASYPQQWVLVKMSSMTPNSETTGENMPWQELITLHADSTFTKHREKDGISSEAVGTFTFEIGKSNPPYVQLSLHYTAANDLIGNCYGDPMFEAYWLDTQCTLQGTWSHCDGPGLYYKRVFENCGVEENTSGNN